MLDETFPKIINGTANLGLLIYEYGLIRAVKTVKRNHWYIKKLIEKSMGVFFNPSYLLGDYNPSYPKAIASLNLGIILLKDFVHTIRHIYRLLAQSLREVKVNAPKLSFKERKELKRHKKKLLRKQVLPVVTKLVKGFHKGYESVGHLYILGTMEELFLLVQRFPSLIPFYKRLKKFFSAVALWENFDVKERGVHKGTSAMQRAGINLEDFGARDFYEAVKLKELTHPAAKSQIDEEKIISYLSKTILQFALTG